MNAIIDCYALHLVRDWNDDEGVIRAKSESHKFTLTSMDYDYYEQEDRVYAPSDKISGSVMLDFRDAMTAPGLVESLQRDIDNDIYTDKSVVVLTLHDDDDGSLNYVENWVRSHRGVNFVDIPEYLRRAEHPDDMFAPDCDYSHDRCYFVVTSGVSIFFLRLTAQVVPQAKRRRVVDEPRTPLTRTISVRPTVGAIDQERRVFGDFHRFVKHFAGHTDVGACSSISLLGKYLVCFNKVIPVNPPIIRGSRFDRDTGKKETFHTPVEDVKIEDNVVVMHRNRAVDINKDQMNSILCEFVKDCAVEVNGDVYMKLHDFYMLFHSFCQYKHGVFLTYIHMHLWFFQACADIFNVWVVERGGEYFLRCMHIDFTAVLVDFEERGWNVHKGLARLELKHD
jgi:hypothetical protein